MKQYRDPCRSSRYDNKIEHFYVLNNLWLCDNIGRLRLPPLRFYFEVKRLNLIQYLVQFKRRKHLVVVNSMLQNDKIVNVGHVLIASACSQLQKANFWLYSFCSAEYKDTTTLD